jgi:hypothetical protein
LQICVAGGQQAVCVVGPDRRLHLLQPPGGQFLRQAHVAHGLHTVV